MEKKGRVESGFAAEKNQEGQGARIKKRPPYHQLMHVVDVPWIISAALYASYFNIPVHPLQNNPFPPQDAG